MPVVPPATLPNDRPLFFRESAPLMRERLRVMGLNFGPLQSKFAELNPLFDGPEFAAGLALAADAATKVKDFDTRVAARMETTHSEDDALAACRPRCQALFYAVRQAWPATAPHGKAAQEAKLKEFGQDKYAAAREQPARMVALIEQASLAVADHTATLAAHGWGAPQQAALVAAGQALSAASAVQGHQGGLNATEAGAYYLAQNQLYWFGQQLSEAADIAFADEPALRDQFRLSPAGPERFTMTLKPGQRKAVHLHAVLAPTRELRFRVQAAAPDVAHPTARVWVDFLPAEDAPLEQRYFLAPTLKGQTQKVLASALGEAGPWLGIENLTDTVAVVLGTVGE